MYGNYYHLSPITGLHLLGSGHAPVGGDGGDEEDWEMRERDRFRSVPSIENSCVCEHEIILEAVKMMVISSSHPSSSLWGQ
jgi:hypothetical protein